jgi:acyl dehydratase
VTLRVFETLADLKACVGEEVAVSDWETITQERIDKFADATGDHQWIHVDPERAATGPFGKTIAHGFLTLSMLPHFFQSSIELKDVKMGINYGLNRVRFTSPVPVGSEVRARMKLLSIGDLPDNGAQMVWEITFERKGADRPVCVAESISRRYA